MIAGVNTSVAQTPDAQLREAAKALEGVFIAQLYQSMRQTVPQGGALDGGVGAEVFTGMFDEQMADALAQRMNGSLGDELYEQLRAAMALQSAPAPQGPDHG